MMIESNNQENNFSLSEFVIQFSPLSSLIKSFESCSLRNLICQ